MSKFKDKKLGLGVKIFRRRNDVATSTVGESTNNVSTSIVKEPTNKTSKRNQKNRDEYLKDIQQTSFVGLPEYEMIISNAKTYLCGKVYPPEVAMGINKDFFGIEGIMELENGMKISLSSAFNKTGHYPIYSTTGWRYVSCDYSLPRRVDVANSYDELEEINNKLYANGCDFNLQGHIWVLNPYEDKISKPWKDIVHDMRGINHNNLIDKTCKIENLLATEKMIAKTGDVYFGCCAKVSYLRYDFHPKHNYYFNGEWIGATVSRACGVEGTETFSIFSKLPMEICKEGEKSIFILQDTDSLYCIRHLHPHNTYNRTGSSLESAAYILATYENIAKYRGKDWDFEVYEIPKVINLDYKLDDRAIMKLFYRAKELSEKKTFLSIEDVEGLKRCARGLWVPIEGLEY